MKQEITSSTPQQTESKEDLKPFIEHLHELRFRILSTLAIFLLFFVFSYSTTPYFIEFIKRSASRYEIDLYIFKLTESVSIYIKTMFFQSLVLTLPFITTQFYLFMKPALSQRLRKTALMMIPLISILFITGAFIGLKLFVPLLLSFFLAVSQSLGVNTLFSFPDYFNFVFTTCLIFGLILEMPAFLGFLTSIQLITPSFLKRTRRFIYPILCFFGVVITPPDFISDFVVTIAMFLLFEISILTSKWIFNALNKREQLIDHSDHPSIN